MASTSYDSSWLRAIRRNELVQSVTRFVPVLILLAFWEVFSGGVVTEDVLPPFTSVVDQFVALATSGVLLEHLGATVFRGVAGICLAVLIAVPTGLLMYWNDSVYRNLDPLISVTYPIPKSALIPLVVVWLGSGHLSRIVLAVIGSILPILINTYNGARGVSQNLLWASRSMGVEGRALLTRVVFPSALPNIMTGIRIGLIFSFVIVISSEMIIAHTGLGVLVAKYGQLGQYDKVFASILWIALVVAGLDRTFLRFSDYILRWSEEEVSSV